MGQEGVGKMGRCNHIIAHFTIMWLHVGKMGGGTHKGAECSSLCVPVCLCATCNPSTYMSPEVGYLPTLELFFGADRGQERSASCKSLILLGN